jgi:lipopolysaccharide export system protein LptC
VTPANRLVFIILVAVAAGAWWLNNRLQPQEPVVERPAPDGFYMTGAEITAPDAEGLPQYRLIAEEIRQVALGGDTLLRDVRVEYNVYSPSPWLLTAPEGRVTEDQAELELWGGVEVIGDSGEHGPARLTTDHLAVDTETSIARTDAPVALTLGAHQLRGTGLVAYLLEERLQLQSQVNGRFLP